MVGVPAVLLLLDDEDEGSHNDRATSSMKPLLGRSLTAEADTDDC